MTDSELIDAAGGTGAVAKLCDIKPPSVSGWRHDGIPKAQRKFLALAKPEVDWFANAELATPEKQGA